MGIYKYIYAENGGWRVQVAKGMESGRNIGPKVDSLMQALAIRDTWLLEHGYELPDDGFRHTQMVQNGLPAAIRYPYGGTNDPLRYGVPENSTVSLVEPPLITTLMRYVVIGDLHCPYHHRRMLDRMMHVAQQEGINTLCIAGDLFDFSTISRHPHNSQEAGVEECMNSARNILLWLRSWFRTIYIIQGNHDERIAKKLDAPFRLERLINSLFDDTDHPGGLVVTNNDYMLIDDPSLEPTKRWVICHPEKYNKNGGTTPTKLAHGTFLCNVIAGHNHRWGVQVTDDGRWLGIDSGHMTDPRLHFYRRRRASTHAEWNAGFVVIKNGFPTTYTEQWTDWRKEGCD